MEPLGARLRRHRQRAERTTTGIPLTLPRAITYQQVADDLSATAERAVRFVDVLWFADAFVLLYALLRKGIAAQPTESVKTLTGREPRTFAEFARDHRAVFTGWRRPGCGGESPHGRS